MQVSNQIDNDQLPDEDVNDQLAPEQKKFWAEVENDSGVRKVSFPNLNEDIVLEFQRFDDDSHHNLKADLEVFYRTFGREDPVYDARFNLRTDQAKLKVAERCALEISNFLNWGDVIERGCRAVIKDYRKGEPVVELLDVPLRRSITYSVEPICPEAQPTIIFGMGGLGKSYVACYAALRATLGGGWDDVYKDQLSVDKKHKVLYLDYEADDVEVRNRMYQISTGLGVSQPGLKYRRCTGSLSGEIETIQKIVSEYNITMVVVDSAGPASGGEPEKTGPAMNFFDAIRTLKVTTLIVAHQAKPQPGTNTSMPFGSAFWWNMARSIWQIEKQEEEGDGHIDIGLFHRKVNAGPLQKPLGFRVEFIDNDGDPENSLTRFERLNLDKTQMRMGYKLPKLIIAILKDRNDAPRGLLSAQAIAGFAQKPLSTVQPVLTRQKNKGILYHDEARGEWGLNHYD